MRVVVIGAGIVGITTAWWLHRAGHEVEVIDRQPGAGLETSWGNGALQHASAVEPWSAPGVWKEIVRSLGRTDAPMLLRPSALPKMWRWGLSFLRNCRAERHHAHALGNLRLAFESLDGMAAIREATGIDYERRPGRVLRIYGTEAAFDAGKAEYAPLQEAGLLVETLDRAALVERDPVLATMRGPLAGGFAFPQDELGDCHLFCDRLAGWLAGRGVRFRWSTKVRGLAMERGRLVAVQTDQGRIATETAVVATGAWLNGLLGTVGLRVPLWPIKGVSLTTPRDRWPDGPRHGLLDNERHMVIVPIGEDRLRVAGSAEITGFDTTPDPARIKASVDRVSALFPQFAACVADPRAVSWAGLRPVTPAGVPLTGRTRVAGLWVNGGHGHTGWTLGCGSSRRLAAMLNGDLPPAEVT
ncbi:MAG: FAD-dependent oxidoreductase [Geminicoccaceae bacterium]